MIKIIVENTEPCSMTADDIFWWFRTIKDDLSLALTASGRDREWSEDGNTIASFGGSFLLDCNPDKAMLQLVYKGQHPSFRLVIDREQLQTQGPDADTCDEANIKKVEEMTAFVDDYEQAVQKCISASRKVVDDVARKLGKQGSVKAIPESSIYYEIGECGGFYIDEGKAPNESILRCIVQLDREPSIVAAMYNKDEEDTETLELEGDALEYVSQFASDIANMIQTSPSDV